jgi:CubicO group peptidase (beta-lactamase class C family)
MRIPNADRITIAQLLDHSSGIYPTNNDIEYLNTLLGPQADPHRVWTATQIVALADKDRKKPAGEPGSGHYYSDTNYVLLGMIVAKAAGVPFKDYVKQTFFKPLHMDSTYFYTDYLAGNVRPRMQVTQGYLVATKDIRGMIAIHPMFKAVQGQKRGDDPLLNTTLAAERIDSAAGIVTTMDDLSKFASALYRGKLLSPRSQALLEAPLQGLDAERLDRERVWTLQAVHKSYGLVLYKDGDGAGGVNTLMAYLPAKDEIFIGFSNSFGFFNEVDFMMDDVIAPWVAKH